MFRSVRAREPLSSRRYALLLLLPLLLLLLQRSLASCLVSFCTIVPVKQVN
jgi:hypothetical protein